LCTYYLITTAFGYLLATPVFAILSDNYKNRRYPLMIGSGCIVVSTLCFSWANTYIMLAVARVFQGASAGASWYENDIYIDTVIEYLGWI
jgi:predicted MFS family arabinose efflux permease